MHYEKLFEKGTIGRLELRNRVVMTAMGTMLGDWNGCSTPEQVRFYEERAKGGCGLIIPEFTSVDPDSGHCNRIQLGIWDARQISSFERICDAVHRHGAKIFVQLHHGGREAPPAINGGRQAMAPSVELNSVVGRDTILPREMTIEDIDRLVGLFIQAALNAQAAGADGVEIHGAHGYLLQQFMSPYTNKRTDEYGGSMENRCRFIVRILKGIREVVEPGFVVGARINGNDFVEGGNDQDACVEIAKYLEPYVDYFNVSCGVYASAATMIEPCYSPEGWRSGFVKAIKSQVSVPIIAVNTVKHPQFAEQLLEEGVSDFVGMSRMHIADPYLVQKTMAGREDLIRKCLGCMNCNKSVVAGRTLHCALNPVAGHEVTFGDDKLVKNGNGRKVAIVGGGPAGMQAALLMKKRGFEPVIFEASGTLGGSAILASKAPCKHMAQEFVDTQIVPDIPGIDRENVFGIEDVLLGRRVIEGRKVAVIGGGHVGLEVAHFLCANNKVTIVEMADEIGASVYYITKFKLLPLLREAGVTFRTGQAIAAVDDGSIRLRDTHTGQCTELKAEAVVLAMGSRPDLAARAAFDRNFDHVVYAGDAVRGGTMLEANRDAFALAWEF